jgi:hypothetical protein
MLQYSDTLYRVWGNVPYSAAAGDYLVDGILRMMYPNYQVCVCACVCLLRGLTQPLLWYACGLGVL